MLVIKNLVWIMFSHKKGKGRAVLKDLIEQEVEEQKVAYISWQNGCVLPSISKSQMCCELDSVTV